MINFPCGTAGLVVGVGIFLGIGVAAYATRGSGPFNLDPGGRPGAFEPFLAKYLRLAEFVIGLATGSIVLLVGSSALRGQGGHLPASYASPLLLLALCVLFAIGFMVWLTYHYEEHQHGVPHDRFAYSLSMTLGFSGLACFCLGYIWLIFQVTK